MEEKVFTWKVHDVPGDGNCLFSALGKSLGSSAQQLRKTAVEWASVPGQKLNGELVSDWIQWNFGVTSSQYLSHLSRNGIWGGANEMSFLANALGIVICVFERSKTNSKQAIKTYEFVPDTKPENLRAICVLYTGNNHYMQIALEKN